MPSKKAPAPAVEQSTIPFHDFCPTVLNLHLRPGQRVIAKVAFGDYDPIDLPGEERELALQMFGGLERVDPSARKYVLLRLGRGSGKTTICSAFAVYQAVTADISRAGPGDVPYVVIVAPDKATAQLSIRMCREMIRSQPALERLVVSDTSEQIQLRRPDGRMVRIEAFAATRGGSAMRGRTIIAFIMDEAEFFTSTSNDREYAVNDRDIFRALKPRLLPKGKGMMISTPWPVETLMGEMFEENWGKCISALAILAPTLLVRGDDPDIVAMVNDEMSKDPENARREYFCQVDHLTGGEFFDGTALITSYVSVDAQGFPIKLNPNWPVAVGCDLGFVRDSSAIVVVQFDGKRYHLVYAEEMKPSAGRPLKPGEVIGRIAAVVKTYGARGAVADGYYKESLKEHLSKHQLIVYDAPEGTNGKAEVFQRTRSLLNEGLCTFPKVDIIKRMVQQARLVTSKPSPGGTTTIRIPRKIGLGHGDIVSAWVLAVHRLAYAAPKEVGVTLEPGTTEWIEESQRRMNAHFQKQQDNYLKNLEKAVRKGMSGRQLAQFRA